MAAYYSTRVSDFAGANLCEVVGALSIGHQRSGYQALVAGATRAWEAEVRFLADACKQLLVLDAAVGDWGLLLEFEIPRRDKRIDVVVLAGDVVLVLEYKVGASVFSKQDMRQVEDYALDLRDFHSGSLGRVLVPVLVATQAAEPPVGIEEAIDDAVKRVRFANADTTAAVLIDSYRSYHSDSATAIIPAEWESSPYRPVPTIIEAAEMLFGGHDVRDVAHAAADVHNLTKTSDRLIEIVHQAKRQSEKVLCFVTGVPGAGKTLAGLNVIHNPAVRKGDRAGGSFLSGNGPLVKIISEALARDNARRKHISRVKAKRVVSTFIQNVHKFIALLYDERKNEVPDDKVVVFDEAQRAWNLEKEKRKFHRDASEPEMMLSIMDRHPDWAVLIGLVGGGQEIFDGEAGLAEWGRAVRAKFPHWRIVASPEALVGGTSVAGSRLFDGDESCGRAVETDAALHLPVSIRSYRAEAVAEWANAVIAGDAQRAHIIASGMTRYPVFCTRSLASAKSWLLGQRGMRRCGLVASSGDLRLRAYGLEVSSGFTSGYRWEEWFLAERGDVLSSNQLEVAATEFQCQGLELDWVGVCWASDLTWNPASQSWRHRKFRGAKWQRVNKPTEQEYLVNKYRVLLTRAREGMVIWVPPGDESDPTLDPALLDTTYAYLRSCGVQEFAGS